MLRHEPFSTGHLVGDAGNRGDVRFDGTAGLLHAALQVLDRDDVPLFVDDNDSDGNLMISSNCGSKPVVSRSSTATVMTGGPASTGARHSDSGVMRRRVLVSLLAA
ncbi:MAG: hypothetical protein MK186_11180 [Henriciella sp.]|nr:hypothetical protein [Henriciella sp.]